MVSPIFLGPVLTQSDTFGLNICQKDIFGSCKKFDTIMIFLGIKFKDTDILGFREFSIIFIKSIVRRHNRLRLVLPISSNLTKLFGIFTAAIYSFDVDLRQARRKHCPIGGGGLIERLWEKSLVPRHFTVSHPFQTADIL